MTGPKACGHRAVEGVTLPRCRAASPLPRRPDASAHNSSCIHVRLLRCRDNLETTYGPAVTCFLRALDLNPRPPPPSPSIASVRGHSPGCTIHSIPHRRRLRSDKAKWCRKSSHREHASSNLGAA